MNQLIINNVRIIPEPQEVIVGNVTIYTYNQCPTPCPWHTHISVLGVQL